MGTTTLLIALCVVGCATLVLGASTPNKLTCHSNFTFVEPPGKWYTKKNAAGAYHFHNDAISPEPQVLRGVSMTGWETGTRTTQAGAGYWLFQYQGADNADGSEILVRNVVKTLVKAWGMRIIRMPICGSAFTQQYIISGWGKQMSIPYRYWVDIPVCQTLELGAVMIIDNHLWAIGKETSTVRTSGAEDGCTGINKVDGTDSCAPHDWYGEYTSPRTQKTYNKGDDQRLWQCAIANADGCTMASVMRNSKAILEHFENLFYELAERYKDHSYVWLEIFNEPYERGSADFGLNFGDNIPESEYNWKGWTEMFQRVITVIRQEQKAENIILVSGHDWSYDYLGDAKATSNMGPILNPALLTWLDVPNIGYAFHPYQHGSCCGAIGDKSDLSVSDPYQSAFCLYPKFDNKTSKRVISNSPVPAPTMKCDTAGYAETVNKKSPPCIWVAEAKKGEWDDSHAAGLCAGDRDECDNLSKDECDAKTANWADPKTGGWSKYVLPMQKYGPLIATEFGPFDCSSPFTRVFLKWCRQFGVSYTAWALWPQNSGGPGGGACGYPSVMIPSTGNGDGFGKGTNNCVDEKGCKALIAPMPWSGVLVAADIADNACSKSPCKNGGTCHDNGMSVTCKCAQAYTGATCETSFSGPCKSLPCKNGMCSEVGSDWKCTCPMFGAYFGNDCADVNECATDNGGCHMKHGECTNTPGSRSCACAKGTEGDGVNCAFPEMWIYNDGLVSPWFIDNPITGFKWTVTEGDMPNGKVSAFGEGQLSANQEIQLKTGKPFSPAKYEVLEFFFRVTSTNATSSFMVFFNTDQQTMNYTFTNFTVGSWVKAHLTLTKDIKTPTSVEFVRMKNSNSAPITVALAYAHFYTPDGEGACADAPCRHGTCANIDGTKYTCTCQAGWEGEGVCGTDINECATDNGGCASVANHGKCTNTPGSRTCDCASGYTLQGTACVEQTKPTACSTNPCLNSGVCAADTTATTGYKCTCVGGYTGNLCQTAPVTASCTPNPCKNSGTCAIVNKEVSCTCKSDFSGPLCATAKACSPNPCVHGTCAVKNGAASCTCDAAFTGDLCDTAVNPTDPCDPSPCVSGSCAVVAGAFKCTCEDGYTGNYCNVPPAGPCAESPCVNGKCTPSGSSYTCTCKTGFTGIDCDQKVSITPETGGGSGNTTLVIVIILVLLVVLALVALFVYYQRKNKQQQFASTNSHMQQTNYSSPQTTSTTGPAKYAPAPPRTLPSRPTGQSVSTRGAWEEYRTTDGYPYFYNSKTGQTSWTLPQ